MTNEPVGVIRPTWMHRSVSTRTPKKNSNQVRINPRQLHHLTPFYVLVLAAVEKCVGFLKRWPLQFFG